MKNKILIIIIFLILVISVALALGFFLKNKKENEESIATSTKWGDIYLDHIQKSITEDTKIPQNALPQNVINQSVKKAKSDLKVSFIEVKEQENPIMILKYSTEPTDYNNGNIIEYSYINNTGKVKTSNIVEKTKFSETSNEKKEIKYLYNIEKDSYDWYIVKTHEEINDGKSYIMITCQPIYVFINGMEMQDNARGNNELFQKASDESIKYMTENTYTFYNLQNKQKFEDIFIDINDLIDHTNYSFTLDMSLKEIRKLTNDFIKNNYKTNQELITPEIEEKITIAKNERKEEQNIDNQNNKEEAKQEIKVGNYTLKFGKYKGAGSAAGETFTIKPNKTYLWDMGNGNTENGTWDNSYGGLSLDGDQWSMYVIANNVLQTLNKDGTYTWYSE